MLVSLVLTASRNWFQRSPWQVCDITVNNTEYSNLQEPENELLNHHKATVEVIEDKPVWTECLDWESLHTFDSSGSSTYYVLVSWQIVLDYLLKTEQTDVSNTILYIWINRSQNVSTIEKWTKKYMWLPNLEILHIYMCVAPE